MYIYATVYVWNDSLMYNYHIIKILKNILSDISIHYIFIITVIMKIVIYSYLSQITARYKLVTGLVKSFTALCMPQTGTF
mgnify:CR=1 FL=1